MTYFPQVSANGSTTQVPYVVSSAFENLQTPLETGMNWAFSLRSGGLTNYPTGPLSRFNVNFSNISDAEVNSLYSFFQSCQGRYKSFRFLDPSGNLLQFSEDFANAYWNKTSTVSPHQPDPFGHTRGCSLTTGTLRAVAGPSDGGMRGMVLCASIYLQALFPGMSVSIGFVDNTTSTSYVQNYVLPFSSWLRISKTLVLPTNDQFLFYLQLSSGMCNAFGAQVSPMKGAGAYASSPPGYGYHENCRFDVDAFAVQAVGPGQNALQLPIVEFNA